MVGRGVFHILVIGLALGNAGAVWGGEQPRIRDEWQPIDHIVISTRWDPETKHQELHPLSVFAAGIAARQGIQVVVADGDDESQAFHLGLLKKLKLRSDGLPMISHTGQLLLFNSPMPTDWARDHSPLVVFTKNRGSLRIQKTFPSASVAQQCLEQLGFILEQPVTREIPEIILSKGEAPLEFAGGDWMTTDQGSTLVTTTKAILKHRQDPGESDEHVTQAVLTGLEKHFGIQRVISLQPLLAQAPYELRNTHADLQVRTLPQGKVIVARVPENDIQHKLLESNASILASAGFEVLRVDNASTKLPNELSTGKSYFKSYANALFLNRVVLIPAFGDPTHDKAAKTVYQEALNFGISSDDPRYYTVMPIASLYGAAAIEQTGSIRCAAHEIHRVPRAIRGPRASVLDGAIVSFNETTRRLEFKFDTIHLLGATSATQTDRQYLADPLRDSSLIVDGATLDDSLNDEDQFHFVGGNVRIEKEGRVLMRAQLRVLSVFTDIDSEFPSIFGTLGQVEVQSGDSSWLHQFEHSLESEQGVTPIFYASTETDLVKLSHGFTKGFREVPIAEVGIAPNSTPRP